MTAPQAGGADHSSRATTSHRASSSGASALAVLLLLGLALRLTIAYILFPGSGFGSDISTYTSWSLTMAAHGPAGFYANAGFADYPPAYLLVLWVVGGLANLLAPLADGNAAGIAGSLIKLPPMLADIAVGALLYVLVRRWAGVRPDAERLGLVAAGLYVFNPVSWYDSALWGQTDAVGALVVLLAVGALVRGNSEGAAALTILAALVKPQFGVVLLPITGAVLLRRHLLAAGSGPQHEPRVPGRFRSWFAEERGPWRLVSSATAGLVVLLALLTPFAMDVFKFAELMAGTAAGYEFLSVNAYNIWALVGADGRSPLAHGGGWSPDTVALLGPVPGVVIGGALLAGSFAVAGIRLLWREDRRTIIVAAIFVALAFFVLPTRVHERYMFPIFALLPLLAAVDRRWLWATVALSAAAFINFHGILTTPLYATPNIADLPLGELFRQPAAIYASVILHTAGFLFVGWRLLPRHAHEPDPFGAPAKTSPEHAERAVERVPVAVPAVGAFTQLAGVGSRSRGLVERLFGVPALRHDRSAQLGVERGGRLDRLDLLLLLVLFVATLGLRTVNLGHPYGMHFDEVYHARTGTEFLQHWRYGMPHSIYEWTHPHLAKYAMAAGIDALGNNRVVGTSSLGVSVRSAALERRWDETGTLRRGDRAYIVTARDLRVLDLADGSQVAHATMFAEAAAVDDATHTLYLVDAGGGIWQLSTEPLDDMRLGPAADHQLQPKQLGRLTLPGRPLELIVARGQLVVLAEGDLLVTVDPASGTETARTVVPGASAVIGVEAEEGGVLIVGSHAGLVELDAVTFDELNTYATMAPVTGMALVEQGVDAPTIYAAAGDTVHLLRVSAGDAPSFAERLTMPAPVRDIYANPAAALVHALGVGPDGSGDSLYVIEPHSNSVFADAALPFAPQAVLIDVQPRRPADDRLNALAFSATGQQATVDVGSNSFAWRFPGVIAGALLALCVYLLARLLFRRRAVAVIAALLVLLDGMAFANARIAMNDSYVALFIVAAFTVFAPLYTGRLRSPVAIGAAVLGVAVLLGLALASKWVGAYALGGIGLLILFRSALGRLIALLAMIGMTALLGYIAISPGPQATQINFLFLGVMVALTTLLAVAMTVRPLRMSRDELRLAIVGPALLGGVVLLAGLAMWVAGPAPAEGALLTPGRLLLAGGGLLALAPISYLGARFAAGLGRGPLARPPDELGDEAVSYPARVEPAYVDPADAPPAGWLRPGSGPLGLPWLATMGTLVLVPLLIYLLSYQPWIGLGNRWTDGFPADHHGQTFLELQRNMYNYHNDLRATHAAGSPWWAWPLDLKPVWFYQKDFAGETTGTIYNTGNMVIFWLGIAGVAFAAYQAWRRRSLALAVLVIGALALWLPWARIDRVTFQYHYFTTLPFVILCLAYFLAELWHGASARSWLFARAAAALAILLPLVLWLVRLPLCAAAGVDRVNPGAEVCQPDLLQLPFAGMLRGPEVMLLIGGLVFLLLTPVFAFFVVRARDARRYVVGALAIAAAWFVIWYPNISGLPVPRALSQFHLGVLPTTNYSFQFAPNTDPAAGQVDIVGVLMLGAVVMMLVAAAIYATLSWRATREERAQAIRAVQEPG